MSVKTPHYKTTPQQAKRLQALVVHEAKATCEAEKGNLQPLLELCQARLKIDPNDVSALANQAVIATRTGNIDKAVELNLRVLKIEPKRSSTHANLARAYSEKRQWDKVLAHSKLAIEYDPKLPVGYLNASLACLRLDELELAIEYALKGQTIDPQYTGFANNLGSAYKEMGLVDKAIAQYRWILEKEPANEIAHTNLLLGMLYAPDMPIAEIMQAAQNFSAVFESSVQPLPARIHGEAPQPHRKLRLGIVSPDFNDHPVMYFVEPLLAGLDRSAFHITLYYGYGGGDHVTERARRMADAFLPVPLWKPERLAQQIQSDGIDILMDVAGHTGKNMLPAFALQPAPVQITWLGYPGTTGLKRMHWRLTDNISDPPGCEKQYTERLAYIPAPFAVYRPCIRNQLARYMPQYRTQPAPALQNGFITFGSCNNIAKLTPSTLRAWGKILQALPGSRLFIEGKGFDKPETALLFSQKCAAHGIPVERLDLILREGKNQYLSYHRIDIALDSFPLTGGTTTFDVLWMGLPIITMEGDSFRSRMGTGILHAAKMQSWIAKTEDEYIAIAVRLAADIPALNARRMAQRKIIEQGPLMNEALFVGHVEDALRQLWWVHLIEQQGAAVHAATGSSSSTAVYQPKLLFNQWLAEHSQIRQQQMQTKTPGERLVFMEIGETQPLDKALEGLATLVVMAAQSDGDNQSSLWMKVAQTATRILETIPHQSAALAAMAQADWATGHREMAICYLSYAIESAPLEARWYDLLMGWMKSAGRAEGQMTQIQQLKFQRTGQR